MKFFLSATSKNNSYLSDYDGEKVLNNYEKRDTNETMIKTGDLIRSNFLGSTSIFNRRFLVEIEDCALGRQESWELELFFAGTNF